MKILLGPLKNSASWLTNRGQPSILQVVKLLSLGTDENIARDLKKSLRPG